jgi:hypothetical protein
MLECRGGQLNPQKSHIIRYGLRTRLRAAGVYTYVEENATELNIRPLFTMISYAKSAVA